MTEFVLGGVILLFGLRILQEGSRIAGESGKLWEVGVTLACWAIFGVVGMSVLTWGEEAGVEFLLQWLALIGVGGLVACVSMLRELRRNIESEETRALLWVEWVLRVMMWGLGCGWLWWMMG